MRRQVDIQKVKREQDKSIYQRRQAYLLCGCTMTIGGGNRQYEVLYCATHRQRVLVVRIEVIQSAEADQ